MPRASTDRPQASRPTGRRCTSSSAPPADPRGGLISAVEGGLWLVSLVGGDGNYPPTDEDGFLAFARSLRSPALYEAIARAEPLTPIAGQRAGPRIDFGTMTASGGSPRGSWPWVTPCAHSTRSTARG